MEYRSNSIGAIDSKAKCAVFTVALGRKHLWLKFVLNAIITDNYWLMAKILLMKDGPNDSELVQTNLKRLPNSRRA